jgi:6-pyruvoyl-tetrahydropterin synthase
MRSATLFLQNFTVLDCALLDPALGPIGESLHVSAELEGELDDKGFIFDFSPAKRALKNAVDDSLDHKLLVPRALMAGAAETLRVELAPGFTYECPAQALAPVDSIDTAGIIAALEKACLEALPGNVKAVKITLASEARFRSEANFRYTHGLRRHDGNCQRLFHGHRNPVEVWQGEGRVDHLEAFLAGEWDNVHYAHAATVLNRADLDLPMGMRNKRLPGLAQLEYVSPQGKFWGTVPASRLVLMPEEPTIENIARLGLERLRQHGVKGPLRVVAYEGLNKGASISS